MKNIEFKQLFDRWLYGSLWLKLLIVLVIALIVFIIPTLIYLIYLVISSKESLDSDNLWTLYYFYADPGTQQEPGNFPKWVAMIMSILGSIFFSGLLISTITNLFERTAEKWQSGFSYYKLKNHIVIIGSDQMVHGLVNQLCDASKDTIVVMTSTDVEQMRNSLHATIKDKKDRKRIIVNYGQRDSGIYLEKINAAHAKEVYILGDTSEFDDIESFHDSLNVQCLVLIAKLCQKIGRTKLPCHVLFDYKTTYHVFQYADLESEITDYIDFYPFNFYDFWARKVLVAGYSKEENIVYKPLDYIPITSRNSEKFVHLIIIGMSKMGQAMALQTAHIAHFPNYRRKKTKITFIDSNGRQEMGEFKQKCGELFKVSRSTYIDANSWAEDMERWGEGDSPINENRYITHYGLAEEYQHLVNENDKDKEFTDVEWEFINGEDHNPIVQNLLEKYLADENAIITVAVCLNMTHVSLRSAMHLPKAYYEKDIPVLVQQRKTSRIVSTLNGKYLGENDTKRDNLLYKNIYPFGMVYDCYDLHMNASVDICKRIAAVYKYYFDNGTLPTHLDATYANGAWDKSPMSKRWSNIYAAASIPTKLRCISLNWDINNPCQLQELSDSEVSLLAEIEHNRWNIEELLLGYRPVKLNEDKEIDKDKKRKGYWKARFIHYDIRPFDGLKEDDKGRKASVYDAVIVRALPLILNQSSSLKK